MNPPSELSFCSIVPPCGLRKLLRFLAAAFHPAHLANPTIIPHRPMPVQPPHTMRSSNKLYRPATNQRAGETIPPMLLPQFIAPPAVPLRAPATSIIVAQNGPSTDKTKAVASANISLRCWHFQFLHPEPEKRQRMRGRSSESCGAPTSNPFTGDQAVGDKSTQRN